MRVSSADRAMPQNRRRMLLLLFASACHTAPEIDFSMPVVSGGEMLTPCPVEGRIGCAPSGTIRVQCQGGIWVPVEDCPVKVLCVEDKADGVVVATRCQPIATEKLARAAWCARAHACVPAVSMHECMAPKSAEAVTNFARYSGGLEPVSLLALYAEDQSACITAAKTCPAVRACLAAGAAACNAHRSAACDGTAVNLCWDGAPYRVDCARVGLPCATLPTAGTPTVACVSSADCSAPYTFACNGNIAQVCAPLTQTTNLQIDFDCGAAGAKCDPSHQFATNKGICSFGNQPCATDNQASSCNGNVLKRCFKGVAMQVDCAAVGEVCSAHTIDGKPTAQCTDAPWCGSTDFPQAAPGEMAYCEGAAGFRSVACAKIGMVSKGSECALP